MAHTAYISDIDNKNRLGDLQRVLRHGKDGISIRWVCEEHAFDWDSKEAIENLERIIRDTHKDSGGSIELDNDVWELRFVLLRTHETLNPCSWLFVT